jgi:hypothetical protein
VLQLIHPLKILAKNWIVCYKSKLAYRALSGPHSGNQELLKWLNEHFRDVDALLVDDGYLVVEIAPETLSGIQNFVRALLYWLQRQDRNYAMFRFQDGSSLELESNRSVRELLGQKQIRSVPTYPC